MLKKGVKLSSGNEIPVLGLGTFLTSGKDTYDSVLFALQNGYRHIDTARMYQNEKEVGLAIKDSKVSRKEIFLTSKVNYSEHGFEKTLKAVQDSLKTLDVEYIDLILIHWPGQSSDKDDEDNPKVRKETWKALEKCFKDGLVKSIGVSNYTVKHLQDLLSYCEIKPSVNQIEFNPFLNQKEDLEFCKKNGIEIVAYGSLGSGTLLENEEIVELSKKYQKTSAQILIKWGLQQGLILIPKSTKKERILENVEMDNWELSSQDLEKMENLNFGLRMYWDPYMIEN